MMPVVVGIRVGDLHRYREGVSYITRVIIAVVYYQPAVFMEMFTSSIHLAVPREKQPLARGGQLLTWYLGQISFSRDRSGVVCLLGRGVIYYCLRLLIFTMYTLNGEFFRLQGRQFHKSTLVNCHCWARTPFRACFLFLNQLRVHWYARGLTPAAN